MDGTPMVIGVTGTPPAFLRDGDHVVCKSITVASTARDAGATPTTTLRAGLVLGKVTTGGLYKEYNHSLSDGTEVARGILMSELNLYDQYGTIRNKLALMLVHGFCDSSLIYGSDSYAVTALTMVSMT